MDAERESRHHQVMPVFQALPPKREQWGRGMSFARHRHGSGYVTMVLSGEYEESGENGRLRASPGDVLVHAPLEAHTNRMRAPSTELFSMELPYSVNPAVHYGRVADPDAIIIQAEKDPGEALRTIFRDLVPGQQLVDEWPDLLAHAMATGESGDLQSWAAENQLHAASLARGFRKLYGIAPAAYRAQLRAHQAWRQIFYGNMSLSGIAHSLGFSDQAHMTRSIKSLTGRSPSHWRRLSSFKT